jgi:hypothetical protein
MMTHLKFAFEVDGDEGETTTISGEGVVVRCERISPSLGHYEVAIFFQSLDSGGSEAIRQYLLGKEDC